MSFDLSPEMNRYVTTGLCPHCSAVILKEDYVQRSYLAMQLEAARRYFFASPHDNTEECSLRPAEAFAKVRFISGTAVRMQCLTCQRSWRIRSYAAGEPLDLADKRQSYQQIMERRRNRNTPLQSQTPLQFQRPPLLLPAQLPVQAAQEIDLAQCRVIDVRELGQIETALSEEKQTYSNNSSVATVTKKIAVSNSISRTVMIEDSQLKALNTDAGVTLIGFATIHGQVQQQLTRRHAVTAQEAISISEETTVEIPPNALLSM